MFTHQLSVADRLQLAWALTWLMLVIDLLHWALATWVFMDPYWATPVVDLLQLLLIAPWIVRRTVRIGSVGQKLVVVRRSNGEETSRPTHAESLSVAWLIMWRMGLPFAAVAGLIFGAVWLLRGVRPEYSPFDTHTGGIALVEELVGTAVGFAILYFWIVESAIRKEYANFWLIARSRSAPKVSAPLDVG